MQQARDFRDEADTLAAVLQPLSDADFNQRTLFKNWTINDVIGHLHMFDHAALLTLQSREAFNGFFGRIARDLQQGRTLLQSQIPWLDGLHGRALFAAWHETAGKVADAYARADPKQRVAWGGPDMSVLSCITARQMETWAHGQEVFDALGQMRQDTDRIRNICHLGASTYGWTFANRKLDVPEPAPYVELTAPSGAIWTWNDRASDARITGSATGFAQVVTQVRNVADTDIKATGDAAIRWMQIAQCFAGPPETPPAKGSRHLEAGA
ncbi:MAG: TIGR03084 family protein [Rhodobacteraceae bacterium]|nr:TIGR03084 family protein [Paracoccaceae bacterium]